MSGLKSSHTETRVHFLVCVTRACCLAMPLRQEGSVQVADRQTDWWRWTDERKSLLLLPSWLEIQRSYTRWEDEDLSISVSEAE